MNSQIPADILAELEPEDLETFKEVGITTNPSDYYFNIFSDPTRDPSLYFVVTPKKYFDENSYRYDGHISQEAGGLLKLDPEYDELCEGEFEASDQTATLTSIEADLTSRGLTKNINVC